MGRGPDKGERKQRSDRGSTRMHYDNSKRLGRADANQRKKNLEEISKLELKEDLIEYGGRTAKQRFAWRKRMQRIRIIEGYTSPPYYCCLCKQGPKLSMNQWSDLGEKYEYAFWPAAEKRRLAADGPEAGGFPPLNIYRVLCVACARRRREILRDAKS